MANQTNTALEWARRRAEERNILMADALKKYAELNSLDEQGVAQFLQCDIASLSAIGLCKRPDTASPQFRQHLEQIALYADANAEKLVRLLRDVESNIALGSSNLVQFAPERSQSFFLAARDKQKPKRPKKK